VEWSSRDYLQPLLSTHSNQTFGAILEVCQLPFSSEAAHLGHSDTSIVALARLAARVLPTAWDRLTQTNGAASRKAPQRCRPLSIITQVRPIDRKRQAGKIGRGEPTAASCGPSLTALVDDSAQAHAAASASVKGRVQPALPGIPPSGTRQIMVPVRFDVAINKNLVRLGAAPTSDSERRDAKNCLPDTSPRG
jgi:hypothetical protein